MARKTKAEAERTRLRILKTSLNLFLEKGYERTTFVDIAESIGLTKGAVYWHFKNKPELLVALVERMCARHEASLGGMRGAESLEGLRDDFVARAEAIVRDAESRKFVRMMTQMDWSSKQARPVKRMFEQQNRGVHAGIERTLEVMKAAGSVRREVDVRMASAVLTAMWLGLVRAKVDHGAAVDLPGAIRFGFDMAIKAMGV